MTIHKLAASHLLGEKVVRPKELESSREKDSARNVRGASRADKIEISEEARTLASQSDDSVQEADGLLPQELEEIRQRIAEGFYDLPSTAEVVARRLLASGDLFS